MLEGARWSSPGSGSPVAPRPRCWRPAVRAWCRSTTTRDDVDRLRGARSTGTVLDRADLVVASPGWPPHHPLLVAAREHDVPVWSEVELAWHVRVDRAAGGGPAPWLAVTGTNGKTTTVGMLESILRAARARTPWRSATSAPPWCSRRPTRRSTSSPSSCRASSCTTRPRCRAQAAAVLNVAPDHLDWHGSLDAYAADKGRIFERAQVACVYNLADPATAGPGPGGRRRRRLRRGRASRIGTPLVGAGRPGRGRAWSTAAFARLRHTHAAELGTLDDLAQLAGPDGTVPPHVVANALAAAALALAHGVTPAAVRDGAARLRTGRAPARSASPWSTASPTWTTPRRRTPTRPPRPSARSPAGSVVWIAGGLAKGAQFDELVAARADRLRAVVLIGVDREPLRDALARHAPEIPVVEVDAGEHWPGDDPRRGRGQAARAAQPGAARPVTVLLAPACASMDQFTSYAAPGRGVRRRRACARWGRVTRREGER